MTDNVYVLGRPLTVTIGPDVLDCVAGNLDQHSFIDIPAYEFIIQVPESRIKHRHPSMLYAPRFTLFNLPRGIRRDEVWSHGDFFIFHLKFRFHFSIMPNKLNTGYIKQETEAYGS